MTWRTILAVGAVASAAVVGCTVTAKVEGGDGGPDSGSGATSAGGKAETGGSGGSSGSGGAKTGGAAGKAGGGGMKATDSGISDAHFDTCNPDKTRMCDNCVQTKCCDEWLDCANDKDCLNTVGGKVGEFICIQDCILGDGGSVMTAEDCAGPCQHGSGTVSSATSSLIACMRDMAGGDAGSAQNCTLECFGRPL